MLCEQWACFSCADGSFQQIVVAASTLLDLARVISDRERLAWQHKQDIELGTLISIPSFTLLRKPQFREVLFDSMWPYNNFVPENSSTNIIESTVRFRA